jgi:hypothetical protein
MAITNPPIALHNAGATHTAEMLRNAFNALISGPRSAASMVSRGGVQPFLGTAMKVVQSGSPGMHVSVGAGVCFVPGSEGAQQGSYACLNQTATQVNVTASHGSLPRIDLIVARVQDSAYSGVTNAWSLEVVTGTAAGSPSAPAAPNNTLILAQLLIAAASTQVLNASITDRRAFLSTGYFYVPNVASLPSPAVEGMLALISDSGNIKRCDSAGQWVNVSENDRVLQKITSTSNSASVGSTETVVQTLGSTTYFANRAYEIVVSGAMATPDSGAFAAWKIRKTNVAGAILVEYPRTPPHTNTNHFLLPLPNRIFTVGGSNVTTALALTLSSSGGTTHIHAGAATYPRGILTRDIGPAFLYTGEVVLS